MVEKRILLLAGLNAALTAAVLGVMFWPREEAPTPGPAPVKVPLRRGTLEHTALVAPVANAHPVFWPQPAPATLPSPAVPVVQVQTNPKLVGLIVRNGVGLAIFEGGGDPETRTLREGETFAGWTLERIAARSARLEQNGHRIIVQLDQSSPP